MVLQDLDLEVYTEIRLFSGEGVGGASGHSP